MLDVVAQKSCLSMDKDCFSGGEANDNIELEIMNDFIAKCLVKDPTARPSALQLLNHPFVKGAAATLEKTKGMFLILCMNGALFHLV